MQKELPLGSHARTIRLSLAEMAVWSLSAKFGLRLDLRLTVGISSLLLMLCAETAALAATGDAARSIME